MTSRSRISTARLSACVTAALALTLGTTAPAAAGPGPADPTAAAATTSAAAAPTKSAAAAPTTSASVAATQAERRTTGEVVPGQYIVVFRPGTRGVADLTRRLAREHGGAVTHTFSHALQGFAGRLPKARVAALARHPDVLSIEPDRVMTVADTQTGATWGLDRSDQRRLPLNGSYTDGNEGAGVHAYIVDTGIRRDHSQFAGRMGAGFDAVTSGGDASDCDGHGTHVAGTVGGATYGIADKVVLHPVRVLDCSGSGTTSGVIAGVDWVRAFHVKPAVANMSLGGRASAALDAAVQNAINAGVTFAVAAGNDGTDACTASPARLPAAVTVGATTSSDARAGFSNTGSCLDLFAPGSSITSAWHTSTGALNTISGTSMASPHVAGAAALYLSANRTASPAAVRNALVAAGTTGAVTGAGTGSPNVLLHTPPLYGGTAPTPTPSTSVLRNGDFESGGVNWTQFPGNMILTSSSQGNRVRTGAWSAWLGGYDGAREALSQTVSVPASGATLTYWWQLTSLEGTSTVYDTMSVQVLSTTGTVLGTLRTRTNKDLRGVWSSDSLSLQAYAGKTVVLRFAATTDPSLRSSFFLDDISVR